MRTTFWILGIIAGLIAGYLGGYGAAKSTYEKKIESAQKYFPSVTDIRSLSGTVKEVKGKTITLETGNLGNPFEDIPTAREVRVTDNTKIIKQEPLDPVKFRNLQDAFQKEMKKVQDEVVKSGKPAASGAYPTPPMSFTVLDIAVSDIKKGDTVIVNADYNIKMEKNFDAASITVTSLPAPVGGFAPVPQTAPAPAPGGVVPQPAKP